MTATLFGCAGSGLAVDLSTGEIEKTPLSTDLLANYLGGKGLGARLLFDELAPDTDPLSPENPIIIATGPLTGTPAPCAGRFELCTKSPQTGLWLDSNCGGFFGPELKYAGYDYIIIRGQSAAPVILVIEDGAVRLEPAGTLWGQDTIATHKALKKQWGRDARVACIGPGGERGVLYAAVISEYRALGRGGAGAVWGAKNLKAIVVRGSGSLKLADPDLFLRTTREAFNELVNNPDTGGGRRKYGTNVILSAMEVTGIHPTANFSRGPTPHQQPIHEDAVAAFFERHRACFGCPIHCSKIARVPSGPYAGAFTEGPEYENTWAFGANCENFDIAAIIQAEYLCDYYGLDGISTGGVIGFLMECLRNDLITEEEIGVPLKFGNADSMIAMIHAIGQGRGMGARAGQGVRQLARDIPGAGDLAMHVKGMELPAYDPRGSTGIALAYATSDRGGCHLRSWPIAEELLNTENRLDNFAPEFKPELVRSQQDLHAVVNSIGLCLFATFAVSLRQFAPWLKAATGMASLGDPQNLLTIGERINNLTRLFNLREGLTAGMDDLPGRFKTQSLDAGPLRGRTIDIDEMKRHYYLIRGWDTDGRPRDEKLKQLGLEGDRHV